MRDGQVQTSYHEPYSPAAPSSVFEPTAMQSVNSLIRLDTIKAAPAPAPAVEEQPSSSRPLSQGSGPVHSHSRSGSRHSAAASVLSGISGDHAEVERLRKGPRATVVDPSSVASLFEETGVPVPKRRGFGILGRLKNKRKDRRNSGTRFANDDSVSAGMSDITVSPTHSRNAGEAPDSNLTPRANKRNHDAGSLERRQLRPRSVRSTHSLNRTSASSLRSKASRPRDGSPSGKRLSQLLVSEKGDGQVTVLSPVIDLGASPSMGASPNMGAWEDEEERLRPPTSCAAAKKEGPARWPPTSWGWSKKNDSDSSVSLMGGAPKLLRNDSIQSTNFSSSSEALGHITGTYDISATIRDVDSSPNSPRFDATGRIMDQRAFSRDKDKFAELNAYLAATAPGTGSPPQVYEVPPPPRARRRQASGASTTESSSSNAMTATVPAENRPQERQVAEEVRVLAPPDFAPQAPAVAAARRSSSHRSHSEPREELAISGDTAGDESRPDTDTLASLPRLPLAVHSPITYAPGAPSDQLSSLGSDYKHRGDLVRSREASDSSNFMPGSQPDPSLDLDPIKAASAPHLAHAKRESSDGTVMSAVQPAHTTIQAGEQSADGEFSFESESLPHTLLRQSVDRASNSTFGRQREVPPPFSSPTFGTGPHPADAAIAQRNYRPETRSSWLSSAGHVPSDDKRSRAQDFRKINAKPAAPTQRKARGRSKSDPAAPQAPDIDTSGDTLPDPVPFPESAVQASLAALHALERSGDLTHEWAFERLMGTAGKSAGQEFAAARKRLELMQEEEEQLQQSRPRRRADPYRSSRLKRASEESASSSRDEPPSRRGSSRFQSHQRHLLEASGMATMSKRSFTGSESDELIDALRKMSQSRKSRIGEKRPRDSDLLERRPRVPSDWRQENPGLGNSVLPMIEEPRHAEGACEEVTSARRVPTAAEWDETVVPAHKTKTTREPPANRPEDSPKSLRSRKLRQSPRQASKMSLPRESFPSDLQNSSFLEQAAPISTTRSHISSSGKKHRPTKQGYEQADIVAWQASLTIAQPPQ